MTDYVGSAFISCSFDTADASVVQHFSQLVDAIGLQPVIADMPRLVPPPDKIRMMISEQNALIAILTRRELIGDSGQRLRYKTSDWLHNEIGMAFGMGKPVAVFVEDGVDTSGLYGWVSDYVVFDRDKLLEAVPKSIRLLVVLSRSLTQAISASRNITMHNISVCFSLTPEGSFRFTGEFNIEALVDGVGTDDRFLYLGYGGEYSLEGASILGESLNGPNVRMEILASGQRFLAWRSKFDPFLLKGQQAKWVIYINVPRPAFPMTRQAIAELITAGQYPWDEIAVVDGWEVVRAIKQLTITYEFPPQFEISEASPAVRVGASAATYEPSDELARLRDSNALRSFSLGNRRVLQLSVPWPRLGYLYAVRWVPTR
jgi:hypothetical protein